MEPASILISELGAQVVREEMVVAIPASLGVEGDQEQVGPFGVGQERLRVLAIGQGPAQPSVEAPGDRDLDEERAQVVVDQGENLVGEVVENEALAATEGVHQGGGVGLIAQ
jgi:hypothetical protein